MQSHNQFHGKRKVSALELILVDLSAAFDTVDLVDLSAGVHTVELMDLSAPFDTVDHDMAYVFTKSKTGLIYLVPTSVGSHLTCTPVLNQFAYIIHKHTSTPTLLDCGVQSV